jgi:rare lipoprotein A
MSTTKIVVLAIVSVFIALAVFAGEMVAKLRGRNPAVMTGKASWYGASYRGKLMANGQRFDQNLLTCATWHWPLGTKLVVEHDGRRVTVLVTDRGPALPLDRAIDLSMAAFAKIAPLSRGVVTVSIWKTE